MNYCHVGESYLNLFYNNYPSPAVPQIDIAGGVMMYFQKTSIFQERERLQDWLNQYFGKEVEMKELPLGLVPLGQLEGDWTAETIRDFFQRYPILKGTFIFKD